jgi:hypothetical protein
MSANPIALAISQVSQSADAAFNKQVNATRDALKIFTVITAVHAPVTAKVAMEELVNTTVRIIILDCLTSRY